MNDNIHDLHDLSDNELADLAQKGSSGAYSILIGRYIFLVRNCAAGYFADSLDIDDLVQEGFIGFMNAVGSFDISCGTSFSTFARLCVERNIISAVRRSLRKKRIPSSMLVFLDDTAQSVTAALSDEPEAAFIRSEEIKKLLSDISAKLSKTELSVLKQYLSGKSYEQIAQTLNISQKSVDNAMQRLRKKLR